MHWVVVGVLIGIGIMLAPLVLRALPWLIGAVGIGAVALMMPPEFWTNAALVVKAVFVVVYFGVVIVFIWICAGGAVVAWRFVRKPFVNDPRPIWRPIPYLSLPDFAARAEAKRIAAAAPAPLASPPASRG